MHKNSLPVGERLEKLNCKCNSERRYPFAYCHKELSEYIDCAIFIDTPLDIAMVRRILRDMKDATGEEIRQDLKMYNKYTRIAYIQMLKDILPSSDYIIDGTKEIEEMAEEIMRIILPL